MKPSAPSLIPPVSSGRPGQSRRNPAGRHSPFCGEVKADIWKSVLDFLTDKLFIVYFICRIGSFKTGGFSLNKIWSHCHSISFLKSFLFCLLPYCVLFSLSIIYLCILMHAYIHVLFECTLPSYGDATTTDSIALQAVTSPWKKLNYLVKLH